MRSNYIQHFFPLLALLLGAPALFAQKNQQSPVPIEANKYLDVRNGVPQDSVKKILQIVQTAFDKYLLYNSLKDPVTENVTKVTLDNFYNLFSVNADISDDVTDITENNRRTGATEEINFSDYGSKMYNLFPKGLTTLVTGALASEISFDSAGFYRVVLVVDKRLRNRFNPINQKAEPKAEYRCYKLDFRYDVPVNLKSQAKIFGISGKYIENCPPIQKKTEPQVLPSPGRPSAPATTKPPAITRPKANHPSMSAFVRFGLGNRLSDDPRSFLDNTTFTDRYTDLALDTKSTFGGGLSAQIPFGNQGMYFGVTLGGQSTSATASFDLVAYTESSIDDPDKGEINPETGSKHDYYVRLRGGQEDIKLSSFELCPGIGKIWESEEKKVGFGAEAQVILRMNSAKGTLSADSASYRGRYKNLDWTTPDTDPKFDPTYGYFKYPVNGTVEYPSQFSAGLRLSPTLRVKVGSSGTTMLNLGADFDLMFGSVLSSNPGEKHILRQKGNQSSKEEGIAYNYLDAVRWGTVSLYLRAGVTIALGSQK